MSACVFCRIVDGTEPHRGRIDGVHTVAFETLEPRTPGHLLFVPREHVDDAAERPDITAATFAEAAAYVAREGIEANLITSVGRAATQSIFHLHVHVVPRNLDDGVPRGWPWKTRYAWPQDWER